VNLLKGSLYQGSDTRKGEPVTDEQLAQQIQQGQPDALTILVEHHYDSLLGYLYRMLSGNRPLAEDLVQETFLRVVRSIDRYTYPRPFKPWLYSIATNLARNYYDSAETRRTTVGIDDVNAPDDAPGIEDVLTHQRNVEHVIAVLDALPDHQREVIILRYYQECSLAEIAEVLKLPVGTVKSRLSIGLSRLRALMEEEEHA
jgi:RNA polymerase sigma-70 factor, ECF subfamily